MYTRGQARQILRKLVVGRLECEAIEQEGKKGYRLTGRRAYDRILPGGPQRPSLIHRTW